MNNVKETKFGMFPGEWEVKSLEEMLKDGDITSHLDGNHGSLYPRSTEFIEEGVPYISANCIKFGRVDMSYAKYLAPPRAKKFKKGIAKNQDVLFAHNATVGPVAVLNTNLDFVILSTTLTYYRCNPEKIDPYYLASYMQSPIFVKQYSNVMGQSTRNQVPITIQRKFFHVLPLLKEQSKIAEILTSIDNSIEKTEAIIEQTEKVKKGLMQQLLTKGIGHTKFKKTEVGEIPEKWEVKPLKELGNWTGGGTPSKQNKSYWSKDPAIIWVSPKDMYETLITQSEDYISEVGLKAKKLNLLPKGTILFVTRSGILRNRVPIALTGNPLTINQDLKALVVSNKYNNEFVFYTLLAFNERIRQSCVKSGTTVESIDFTLLKDFSIPIPSLGEQVKIVLIIDNYYKKLENEHAFLSKLQTLKKGLMQVLLTGKVRVKVDEEEVITS